MGQNIHGFRAIRVITGLSSYEFLFHESELAHRIVFIREIVISSVESEFLIINIK